MSISQHPAMGSVLRCGFDGGFKIPEIVKERPVIVISPAISDRDGLCTVVALSTTPPEIVMPYHCQLDFRPKLPRRWQSEGVWVKGDMIYAISYSRLNFMSFGNAGRGRRRYYYETISDAQLKQVRQCILRAMGLSVLTKHL